MYPLKMFTMVIHRIAQHMATPHMATPQMGTDGPDADGPDPQMDQTYRWARPTDGPHATPTHGPDAWESLKYVGNMSEI